MQIHLFFKNIKSTEPFKKIKTQFPHRSYSHLLYEHLSKSKIKSKQQKKLQEHSFAKIKTEKSNHLNKWILTHHKNWIGHAVWSAQAQEKIFNSKNLRCSEEVLIIDKTVEYEQGSYYGERGTLKLPQIKAHDIKKLKDAAALLGPHYGFFFDPTALKKPIRNKIPDHIENFLYVLKKMMVKYSVNDGLILQCYENTIEMEKKFDTFLFHAYKELVKKAECQSILKPNSQSEPYLSGSIYKIRHSIFNGEKLLPNIRAQKNKISWDYGDVAIIKGNATQVIGFTSKNEVGLLFPWQNNGKLFSLDLTQPDTIVIGPKRLVKKYTNESIVFVAFEEMNDTQLNYFSVPIERRPNRD